MSKGRTIQLAAGGSITFAHENGKLTVTAVTKDGGGVGHVTLTEMELARAMDAAEEVHTFLHPAPRFVPPPPVSAAPPQPPPPSAAEQNDEAPDSIDVAEDDPADADAGEEKGPVTQPEGPAAKADEVRGEPA